MIICPKHTSHLIQNAFEREAKSLWQTFKKMCEYLWKYPFIKCVPVLNSIVLFSSKKGVWRSLTDTGPELLPSVKSGDTRRAQNFSSGNSPSSAWSVRLPRILRPTWDSRVQPLGPYKRPVKLTWSVCLRTQICAPFMPNESQSCLRTFNWLDESGAREHRE